MKVSALIELLKKEDPNADVVMDEVLYVDDGDNRVIAQHRVVGVERGYVDEGYAGVDLQWDLNFELESGVMRTTAAVRIFAYGDQPTQEKP